MKASLIVFLLTLTRIVAGWECGGADAPIPQGPPNRRHLITRSGQLSPLRISFQYIDFDLGSPSANTFFKDTVIPAVDSYVRRALKVYSVQGNLLMPYSTCGSEIAVPVEHQTTGVPDTDIIVYVTDINSTAPYLAYAGPCAVGGGLENIIAGRMVINLRTLTVGNFQSVYPVVLHELWHILGFVAGIMPYWKKADGTPYKMADLYEYKTIRGAPKSILKTPNVLGKAKEVFNCQTLAGVETDGAGINYGSHWNTRIMFNDFMIPYDNGMQIYSSISLALLKDTGWYEVDYSAADLPSFGRNYGCPFFESKCLTSGVSNFPKLFCDTSADWTCDPFHLNKGACKISSFTSLPNYFQYFKDTTLGGTDSTADYCPYKRGYSNGNCRGGFSTTFTYANSDEVVGPNSRCFKSTLMRSATISNYAACYEITSCTATYAVVKIGTQTINCPFTGATLTVTGYTGTIICPDSDVLCTDVPCLEGCRGVGICVKGVCRCILGYTGSSCQTKVPCNTINGVSNGLGCDCKPGYYNNVGICTSCATSCSECLSSSSCTKCKSGYFLAGGTCNQCFMPCTVCSSQYSCSQCTSGFFISGSGCNICPGLCQTCTSSGCLTCKPDSFSSGNTCLCNSGWYNSNSYCVKCVSPCITCNSISGCQSCVSGYYLSGSSCLVCPGVCLTCDSTECQTCKLNARKSGFGCICNDGYFLLNGSCELCNSECTKCSSQNNCFECITGYYISNGSCLKCFELCLTCDSSTCLTCKPNSSVVSSTCKCNTGLYNLNGVCASCQSHCSQCSSLNSCNTCIDGFYILSSACYKCPQLCSTCDAAKCLTCVANSKVSGNACACELGFYQSGDLCLSCPDNCLGCSGLDFCFDCKLGYSLYQNQCFPCTGLCTKCSDTECLNCKPNALVASGQCSCSTGFFSTGETCESCVSPCVKCSSLSICEGCTKGFYLHQNFCSPCASLCLECDSTSCSVCKPNSHVIGETCVCKDGFYEDGGNCVSCISPCSKCSGANLCDLCAVGYYVYGNICHACPDLCVSCDSDSCIDCKENAAKVEQGCQCISGYYIQESTCQSCPLNCKECKNPSECTICQNGLSLSGGQCITCPGLCLTCSHTTCLTCNPNASVQDYVCKCLTNYYQFQNECIQCPDSCLTCSSSQQCQSCRSGFYLVSDSCLACSGLCQTCDQSGCLTCKLNSHQVGSACVCDFGMFNDNGNCNYCPYSCLECNSLNDCQSCLTGYFLNFDICEKCFDLCLECDKDQCSKCVDNSVSIGNTCKCLDGFYHTTGACSKCTDGCLDCVGLVCSKCYDGYYLNDLNSCTLCSDLCQTCDKTGCIVCVTNAVKSLSQCSCRVGFYNLQNTCLPCISPCGECTSASACIKCENGYYLGDSVCVKCPSLCLTCDSSQCFDCIENAEKNGNGCRAQSGFYEIDGNVRTCIDNCLSCTGPDSCLTCMDRFVFKEGKCQNCPELCLTCNSNECLTCVDHSSVNEYICVCEDSYYLSQGQCAKCGTDCLKCSNIDQCDLCPEGYFHSYGNCFKCPNTCLTCDSSTCLTCKPGASITSNICKCDSGIEDSSGNCLTCSLGCKTCSVSGDCITCEDGYLLNPDFSCRKCDRLCNQCSENSCKTCRDNAVISGSLCVCKIGFYLSSNSCQSCTEGCTICNSTACSFCEPKYYLSDRKCVSCPSLCLTCIATKCTSCTTNAYILNGLCLCRAGFYNLEGECALCPNGCTSCLTASNCFTCLRGYYILGSSCLICPELCLSCNSTSCIQCKTNAIIENNNCACRKGYYNNQGVCTLCTLGCSKCSASDSCSECINGYYLSDKSCNKCDELCTKCDITKCLTCKPYAIISSNTCICRNGAYYNAGSCSPCKLGCSMCTGIEVCSSCSSGYYLTDSSCTICQEGCSLCGGINLCTGCKLGFYLSSGVCNQCSSTFCSVCNNNICTRCITGYVLAQGICVFLA